jgi:hypothetical protein
LPPVKKKIGKNMKRECHFFVLSICLLAGCTSNNEAIRFSGEPVPPPDDSATRVAAEPKELSRQDLFKVELAVYGYLLQRHFWDGGEYSAIFVQGTDEEVNAVIKQFPRHLPPVKTSDRVQLSPNRVPLDKDTGQPAMILSVDVLDPEGGTVQAIGKWYAGSAVSGFYTFSLQKSGGEWAIKISE